MSHSLSWYAVRGKTPQQLRDELGLEASGEREPFAESPLVGIQLPGDWYAIVANRHAVFGISPDEVRLSARCDLVACFFEEHVMCSSVEQWIDGHKVWSVLHDSGCGILHLKTEGKLPCDYGVIINRLIAEQKDAAAQANVDFAFDIPLELAKKLTGFRHDESTVDRFEVLNVKAGIATGAGFRIRRAMAGILGTLTLASAAAVLLLGIGVALFGVLALIVTILQRLL